MATENGKPTDDTPPGSREPEEGETTGSPGDTQDTKEGGRAGPGMILHYIRSLSFENPVPLEIVNIQKYNPQAAVNFDVRVKQLTENTVEVVLSSRVRLVHGETTLFTASLAYGGIFSLPGGAGAAPEYLFLAEAPQMLFPYVRKVIADMSRDGGFPPFFMEAVDFRALYRQKQGAGGQPSQMGQPLGHA